MRGLRLGLSMIPKLISFGPELMPDSEFSSGTGGFVAGGSATVTQVAGKLHVLQTGNATQSQALYTSLTNIVSGQQYRIQASLTVSSMAGLSSSFFGAFMSQFSPGTGLLNQIFTATATGGLDITLNMWNAAVWAPLNSTADLDYLRVSKVT